LKAVQKLLTGSDCAVQDGSLAACLEHPDRSPIQVNLDDFLGHLEHDRQPRLDCVNDPGGHVGGGVPVAGADAAAAVQLAVAAALVAHEFVDHPSRDAGVLQPGREGVSEVADSQG
jgi:hypothetical protein